MSASDHGALYGFESFDFFSLDDFLLRTETARNAIGLSLAQAALEEALVEHEGERATAISEQGEDQSGVGLGAAQAALEGTPVPPDLIANGPLSAPEDAIANSGGSEPAGARGPLTFDSGGITGLEPQFSGAKGGVPGPPSDGGGGGGGDDGGVLPTYDSGSDDGEANYDIWIEFKGSDWTVELQQAFKDAADYLTTVVVDDIGGGARYRGTIIDDLYISAEVKAIDGDGGVLGQAGPTALWSDNELPAAGIMEFDVADVSNFYGQGLWDDIVTHEMMHVLGFGSLWNYGRHAALVEGNNYIGENALAAYRNDERFDSDATFIPVEADGGSGTAGAHWDEVALENELMTGYIDANNDLSEFSVMALADLGYNVGYQDYPYDGTSSDALMA